MCVIMLADDKRATEEMIRKGFESNPDGGGFAWRDGDKVKWKKGLNIDESVALAATLPIPYVAHFRIPSCGGKSPFLCHPFPVEKTVSLKLEGATKAPVLFHNGHWGDWRKSTLETCVRTGYKLPPGRFSDSRAMAFAAFVYGPGILDMIDEKSVAFSPTTIEVNGSGWTRINDVWCSNTSWQWKSVTHHGHNQFHGGNRQGGYTPPQGIIGDEDEELPGIVIDTKILDAEVDAAEAELAAGGSHDTLPFDKAWRLFKAGKISKKAFKRAKKQYEDNMKATKLILPGGGSMTLRH